jgi:uncharacterized protein YjbI with pentapeptide repeats
VFIDADLASTGNDLSIFVNAVLTNADFTGASLAGADFTGADLTGTVFP